MVVGQHDLRQVNALALSAELQQRYQSLVEDGSLLDGGVAVVEDLGKERVQTHEGAHVRPEQRQCGLLVTSSLGGFLVVPISGRL